MLNVRIFRMTFYITSMYFTHFLLSDTPLSLTPKYILLLNPRSLKEHTHITVPYSKNLTHSSHGTM